MELLFGTVGPLEAVLQQCAFITAAAPLLSVAILYRFTWNDLPLADTHSPPPHTSLRRCGCRSRGRTALAAPSVLLEAGPSEGHCPDLAVEAEGTRAPHPLGSWRC